MHSAFIVLASLLTADVTCVSPVFSNHGRRVCIRDTPQRSTVLYTESFVQPVHKPYITVCQGHRLCSTYKTLYRVSYRQVKQSVPVPHLHPECCPGWRRYHSYNCNQALCSHPCVNGGTCTRPEHCNCPNGWTGRYCQTDLDECSGSPPCAQQCLNTPGSYQCRCRDGFQLAGDGQSCEPVLPTGTTTAHPKPNRVPPTTSGNSMNEVTEEMRSLKTRVELLEKKLQLALDPFNSLFPLSVEEDVSERTSFLSHSFQQLDRIDSLSEQIGFLEERLGTCSCQEN